MRKTMFSDGPITYCLRSARQAAGLSQVQLAQALGHGQSWVSKIESGERRLGLAEAARILDVLLPGCRVVFEGGRIVRVTPASSSPR